MDKFALLQVGINAYPRGSELQGCVNDLTNFRSTMSAKAWKPDAESRLQDRMATAGAIRSGMKWLLNRKAPIKLFQYSGHGTLVRDQKPFDEPLGYDGAIVPQDYGFNGLILDDEMGAYAQKIYANGSKLIFLFDSCFSGAMQRSFFAMFRYQKARFLRDAANAEIIEESIDAWKSTEWADVPPNVDANAYPDVLIATSQANTTSADAYIQKKYQGAGTYALMVAWNKQGTDASYLSVQRTANQWLADNNYSQRITLGGTRANLSRPVFR